MPNRYSRKRSHIDVKAKASRYPHRGEVETQQRGSLDIPTWGALYRRQNTLSRTCRQPIVGLRTGNVDKLQKNPEIYDANK